MGELEADTGKLERALSPSNSGEAIAKLIENEAQFRFSSNEDAMATEKLAQGIRGFVADQINLENFLKAQA